MSLRCTGKYECRGGGKPGATITRPAIAPRDLGPDWEGGFFCPCHGSRYDLAGRVLDGSPAPLSLPVPPYYYVNETTLRVGELAGGGDQNWRPETW